MVSLPFCHNHIEAETHLNTDELEKPVRFLTQIILPDARLRLFQLDIIKICVIAVYQLEQFYLVLKYIRSKKTF